MTKLAKFLIFFFFIIFFFLFPSETCGTAVRPAMAGAACAKQHISPSSLPPPSRPLVLLCLCRFLLLLLQQAWWAKQQTPPYPLSSSSPLYPSSPILPFLLLLLHVSLAALATIGMGQYMVDGARHGPVRLPLHSFSCFFLSHTSGCRCCCNRRGWSSAGTANDVPLLVLLVYFNIKLVLLTLILLLQLA